MRFRLFRKWGNVCQNCIHGDNIKGKYKKTIFRKSVEGELKHWNIFCKKKQKYFPWDNYKLCFKTKRNNTRLL